MKTPDDTCVTSPDVYLSFKIKDGLIVELSKKTQKISVRLFFFFQSFFIFKADIKLKKNFSFSGWFDSTREKNMIIEVCLSSHPDTAISPRDTFYKADLITDLDSQVNVIVWKQFLQLNHCHISLCWSGLCERVLLHMSCLLLGQSALPCQQHPTSVKN